MWYEDVEDISIDFEENGILLVKQEAKVVITKGTWSVIAFLYREWDAATESYGPAKATLRKFSKQRGTYRQESKFNIGSLSQARAIAQVLEQWAAAEQE